MPAGPDTGGITVQLARERLAAGLCVLPAIAGDKRPALPLWHDYRGRLPTGKQVDAWFSRGREAVCIVAGAVSGGLECIDFDAHGDRFDAWRSLIPEGLFNRLLIERTPSGGYHAVYRCGASGGNQKLAEGVRGGKMTTLVETRAEGGLFLCAPSPGYSLIQGAFESVPTISADERSLLLDAARSLDERPAKALAAPPAAFPDAGFDMRPGDAFNADATAFRAFLESLGWRLLGRSGGNENWQRPGKEGPGLSATFNGATFYVFSSSIEGLEPGRGYSPFGVYAALAHGGDTTAAARELLAEGFGTPAAPCASVDLSGMLSRTRPQHAEPVADPGPADPGPIPDELLRAPGFIDEVAAYTMETAHKPNRVLAFAGALALNAYLLGRLFKDVHDTRMNVYILAVAPSGAGKEHPRAVNKRLTDLTGLGGGVLDDFGSAPGIEDFLILQRPSAIYQVDEIDTMFNKIRLKDAASESISKLLLSAFSASSSYIARRSLAAQRGRGGEPAANQAARVREPNLVLFGTGVPHLLYDSLTKRSLENGLFARCLTFETKDLGVVGRPLALDPPRTVLDYLGAVRRLEGSGDLASIHPAPRAVPYSREAEERARAFAAEMEVRKTAADERADFATGSIWGRAAEKQGKLALSFALSRGLENPSIELEDIERSAALVEHITRSVLYRIETSVHETDYEEQSQRILRLLRARSGTMPHSALLKASHLDRDTFRRVVETLIEGGQVIRETVRTGRNAAAVYSTRR